jgi:hypothetical protein
VSERELTIEWPGASGRTYTYWIAPISASFKAQGGNYIFAKQTQPHVWTPVYIGQTGDLNDRLASTHERMQCILADGATHIHTHLQGNAQPRIDEETDLIRKWDPPCNRT